MGIGPSEGKKVQGSGGGGTKIQAIEYGVDSRLLVYTGSMDVLSSVRVLLTSPVWYFLTGGKELGIRLSGSGSVLWASGLKGSKDVLCLRRPSPPRR